MSESTLSIQKYGRFFAVYDGAVLVCVCVYRKGAARVIELLTQKEG